MDVDRPMNWTSQILPNLALESRTTDFELLQHSFSYRPQQSVFDGVAQ